MIEWLRRLLRPYPVLKRGIVNLKTGTSFRAVVYRQAGAYLVLRNVEILEDRGTQQKGNPAVDGEVLVAHADIDFIQVTG